jgi:hypothetical protein
LSFRLTGVANINETSIDCICATDPQCQSPVVFYDWQTASIDGHYFTAPYVVPGMMKGCFVIDSLLLSTLECFYSSFCLSVLYYYIDEVRYNSLEDTGISWFDAFPLVYEQTSCRFTPNTSLQIIVQGMMIEQWNVSTSFDRYYDTCTPTYCTYSDTAHTKNFIGILITLVSTISGLTVTLRIITPLLVKFVFYLLQPKVKKQQRGNYKSDVF